MSAVDEMLSADRTAQGAESACRIPERQRPSFSLSDLWKAPLHDFPIRDEILYQYLPISKEMDILEIGPGSGFTAFRLARRVNQLTLVDVSSEAVAELQKRKWPSSNVRFVRADLSQVGLADQLKQKFHAAFGLDVLEYVVEPGTCLANLAQVLRPGGSLLLTYPNVPPPVGDGVTYFEKSGEIESLLVKAGFKTWDIFAVQLRPWAGKMFAALHETPLRLFRKLRRVNSESRPQTYEATWAFQHRSGSLRYKLPLHCYWVIVEAAMGCNGEFFEAEPVSEVILNKQLVIRARR